MDGNRDSADTQRVRRERNTGDDARRRPVAGSLFSGIGGLDLGLERAGFTHAFFCEADAWRRRVLARHWPGTPIYDDVRNLGATAATRAGGIDLLCGGFPCQDLSVAGRRRGLAGERSGLFYEFARLADALLRPGGWVLIENVPGLLSSNDGRDFAVVLATLAELGFHDLAWRTLDSRYLGVPQRRRRVFILGRRARGRRACSVLLEPESGGGNFAPSREARQGVADSVADGARAARTLTGEQRTCPNTEDFVAANGAGDGRYDRHPLTVEPDDVVQSLTANGGRRGYRIGAEEAAGNQIIANTVKSEDGTGRGTPLVGTPSDADRMRTPTSPARRLDDPPGPEPRATVRPLTGGEGPARLDPHAAHAGHLLPRTYSVTPEGGQGADLRAAEVDTAPALSAHNEEQHDRGLRIVGSGPARDHCPIDPPPDGPRYAGCGDAVTANVAEWIGRRLLEHGLDE